MKKVISALPGVFTAVVLIPAVQAAQPWDVAFAHDTTAVVTAARAIDTADDDDIVILLEQHRYSIDSAGCTTASIRRVYRVLKQAAVEEWSSIEQPYDPWHESRPQLRARVIAADGAVHWLDGNTVADSPVREFDASIFSDRRVIRAPLPAISNGSVVEYEIFITESAALFDAGVTRRIPVPDHVPVQRFSVTLEAAKNIRVRTATPLIPESSIRREAGRDVTSIRCELGPIAAQREFELNLASEVRPSPYFAFSTGGSWQEVAARYDSIVNQQIGSAATKALLLGLDLTGEPVAVASRIVGRLHGDIRYTGVEFGEAAIVPRTPSETLARGYGDCKDKATLLVAMLRAAGMTAHVALLSSGFGPDVDADLPGLGVFDHAIVHVRGEQPLWIDATAPETRVGTLPISDQGRLALIAATGTTNLVTTPESTSGENRRVHLITIRMSEFGPGNIHERIEAHGSFEAAMRQQYDASDEKTAKNALEARVKQQYLAKALGSFGLSKRDDWSAPFRLEFDANRAKRVLTFQDDAIAVLLPHLVLEELPFGLSWMGDGVDSHREKKRRKHDLVMTPPHQLEYRYKIHPPGHFRLRELPQSAEIRLGPATYSRSFKSADDGTVEAVFRFDTGKRRFTAAEYETFRQTLGQQKWGPEMLQFHSKASEHVALGQIGKAVKLAVEAAAKSPVQGAALVRLSRMLVIGGAVDHAIATAERAIELDGQSSPAWQALGWALQHDSFGRRFKGNWNPAEAEKCYRKAIALDDEDAIPRMDLAILLEHNRIGNRYGKGARLEEAVAIYREALKITPEPTLRQNLAITLLHLGRFADVKQEMQELPETELKATLTIVVTAALDGPARAIIHARSAYPDDRARAIALANAATLLIQIRRYENAHELMQAAVRLLNITEMQNRLELTGKLKRHEQALLPASDPAYPAQQLLLRVLSGETDPEQLKPLFTRASTWAWREIVGKMERDARAMRARYAPGGAAPELVVDMAMSLMELAKEGEDATGYRIAAPLLDQGYLILYVIREDGDYKIFGSPESAEEVGRVVLASLTAGNLKKAQWWLDRVEPDVRAEGGIAVRLMPGREAARTRQAAEMRLAATVLIARHSGEASAIKALIDARARAPNQLDRSNLDVAICRALLKAGRVDELAAVARRLGTHQTFANESFEFIVAAAKASKQWGAVQAEAERRAAKGSENLPALRAIAENHIQNGRREAAAEYLRRASASVLAGPEEHAREALNSVILGTADRELLARLQKSREHRGEVGADYWYTLAMLQLVLHKPEDAQRSLTTALDQDDESSGEAVRWAVSGKIWDEYGLPDAAATAFEKARTRPGDTEIATAALQILIGKRGSAKP